MKQVLEMKNILVISELFIPTKGGTAVWFDEVYRRLGGKDIHIVTAQVEGSEAHDAHHPNSVHRINLQRIAWLRPESLAMYIKLLMKCLRLVLTHRIDAVHAGRVLPEGLVGLLVARLFRKPLITYAHGEEITTWRQSGKFKAMRFTYRHSNRVIANSRFTKKELLNLGVHPEKILLISPGVDIDRFRPGLDYIDLKNRLKLGENQKLILSVGRLTRRKGFDRVIESLQCLRDQGIEVHYAIIGIGEDREYLESLATSYNVWDYVHFLGHVPTQELPRWYNACDLFVMPNREIDGDTEGFGMVFLEAAACGKPAIAGLAGGTGDAVEHEVTGFRIDGSTSQEVAINLLRLLKDKDLVHSISEKALERTVNHYSWEAVATKTSEIRLNDICHTDQL